MEGRVFPRFARGLLVITGALPWVVTLARAWLPLGAFGVMLDACFVTMCHRMPERTLTLWGVAMPVCSRCAGVFAGAVLGAIVARPRLSGRGWRWMITLAGALMAADVATQDLGVHPVWHAARLATGALFGFAVAAACVIALEREAGIP